ncbi:hypothetical protein Tco_0566197 [Tanacetum coccineum]
MNEHVKYEGKELYITYNGPRVSMAYLEENPTRLYLKREGKGGSSLVRCGSVSVRLAGCNPNKRKERVEVCKLLSRVLNDRDDRNRDDPIRSLGLKIEIPEFTGKVHLDDFIDWLSTAERVFDVRDIPDKLKVKLVAIKL